MTRRINFFRSDLIYLPNSNMKKLFWSYVARNVSINFLALYSAIYVFRLYSDSGYSIKTSLLMAIIFDIVLYLTKQMTFIFSENISQKKGFKGVMELSLFPFLLSIISFILAGFNVFWVFIAAVCWGFHAGLYWWGYHGYFIKAGDSARYGMGIGEQEFLKTSALVVSPVIGALFINIFGFAATFILALVFMVFAIILIRGGDDVKQKHDIKLIDVLKLMVKRKSTTIAYVGEGAEAIIYSLGWPIYIYMFFGNVINLGILISLSLFLSALLGLLIGGLIDRRGVRQIIAIGTPLFIVSWFVRIVFRSFPMYILADTLRLFGDKMVALPLVGLTYKKGKEGYTSNAILFRETSLGIGSLLALIIFLLLIFLEFNYMSIFIFGLFFGTFPLILVFNKNI